MDKYDPATKHSKNWLAFLLCSHLIDYFTGRCLSLQSCVPPPLGQPDMLKYFHQRICKILSAIVADPVQFLKARRKELLQGVPKGTNSTVSNSSFTHTVQLVSNRKDYEELAHIK
jgi:hypothetical protein